MGVSAFHADTMLWADNMVRVRGVCEVTPSMASIICFLATSGISFIMKLEKGTHKPSLGKRLNNKIRGKFEAIMNRHPPRPAVVTKAHKRKWSALLNDGPRAVRFEDRKVELLSKLRRSLGAKKVF